MSEPSMELVVAGVGEIVNLNDAPACVAALSAIRDLESRLREAKAILTDAVAEECKRRGTKTLDLPAGGKAVYADGKCYAHHQARATASPYDVSGNPTKDYPGE